MSDRKTSEIAVTNRMNIPLFLPGKGSGPSIFSSGDMNVLVRALRALTNPHITWGEKDEARITDGNFLLTLSRSSANQEGSKAQQYVLTDASNGEYFICRTLSVVLDVSDPEDPILTRTVGDADIYIARPYEIRRSPFDRAVLNEAAPGNIGTTNEITRDVKVEAWDGATFSSSTMKMSFEYKSANYRIATDATDDDPDNWTTEKQTIIPRLVPAITEGVISPTIIYADKCAGLGVTYQVGDDTVDVTLLARNDGWAWMRSTV